MNATAKKERTPEQLEKMRAGLAKARATAAANRAKRTANPEYGVGPAMAAVREQQKENKDKAAPEFEGITAATCCDACRIGHCVVSGDDICTHPYKGGLHAKHMIRPDIVQRFNRAKKTLVIQAAEKRP